MCGTPYGLKHFTKLSITYAPSFYRHHAQPEQTWGRLLPRLLKLFKGVLPSMQFAEACLGKLVLQRGPHANEADLLSIIRWDLGGNEGAEVASREVRFS